ncbi:MAG: hypothetical protein PHI39_04680 [Kiritimatiellae bacterium]|jgi:hypothetical protein|nr:hypothetical protein [Kiritimatiellia bacterium]
MTPRPKPERPRKDAMKNRDAPYFPLSLDSLRAIGGWAADGAERALPVFKRCANSDPRPRAAIEGIRAFAAGGKRAARLRSLACQAHAAARETDPPAAAAAARAAGHAAASAYTHPLADVQQTLHIVGSAAYAALALELDGLGHSAIGDAVVRLLVQQAPPAVRDVLRQMPARTPRNSRLAQLLYSLDSTIRARS